MTPKFNDLMEISIDKDIVRMETENDDGLDFEVKLLKLKNNLAQFNINYVYDKKKNRKLKSQNLTKKYSSWIASILFKCREEGII